jgi:two-component system, NarL family, response regulator NreC
VDFIDKQVFESEESDFQLSYRETMVLQLVSNGLGAVKIAEQMFISKRTVDAYRQTLLNKLSQETRPTLSSLPSARDW